MAYLITDVDGVLLDWAPGFKRWFIENYGPPLSPTAPLDPNKVDDWIKAQYPFFQDPYPLINAFQQSLFFGELPAYPDALEWLPQIAKLGHEIHVVSSCGTCPSTRYNRRRNLHAHFGDIFSSFTLIGPGLSKRDCFAAHPPGSVLVEDAQHHVTSAHECGHHAFHLDRLDDPHPVQPVVSSWAEVYQFMCSPKFLVNSGESPT